MVIGVVGGIGSGKSTIARQFGGLGCQVIEADRLGHQVLQQEAVKEALRQQWGEGVFNADGSVNRQRLADHVFESEEQWRALCRISHPRIRALLKRTIAAATPAHVALEAAVLYEAEWQDLCAAVVFVEASETVRLQRVKAQRGWTAAEVDRRERFQKSLNEKRLLADYMVDNSGDLEVTFRQVAEIFAELTRRSGRCSKSSFG